MNDKEFKNLNKLVASYNQSNISTSLFYALCMWAKYGSVPLATSLWNSEMQLRTWLPRKGLSTYTSRKTIEIEDNESFLIGSGKTKQP